MLICPRCQAQNPDGALQCVHCGYPLQQNPRPPFNYGMPNQMNPYGNRQVISYAAQEENKESQKGSDKSKKKTDKLKILLLIFCILLLISNAVILYLFLNSENHKWREAYMDLAKTMEADWALDQILQIPGTVAAINGYEKTDNKSDKPTNEEILPINIGDSIHFDYVDMSFEKVEWTDDIYPLHASQCSRGVRSSRQKKTGETYLTIWGTVKNISGETIDIDEMPKNFVFNDTYNYTAHVEIEDADGCNTSILALIRPLEKTSFLIWVSVPEEIKTIFEHATFTFGFKDYFAKTKWNDFSDLDHIYQMEISK